MSVFYFIKAGFFLLVMLVAIIITILMIRSDKQRERDNHGDTLLDLVNQMGGIGSEFDKMILDVDPKYRLKKDPKHIYRVLIFEIMIFLIFIFGTLHDMMEQGYMSNIHDSPIWVLIVSIFSLVLEIMILRYRKNKKKQRIRENKMEDTQVEGTIVNIIPYGCLPGYGKVEVSYYDPYELCNKSILLQQQLRVKKYPVGEKYMLLYSQSMHEAYDLRNNKIEDRRDKFCQVFGVILLPATFLSIIMALISIFK